MAGVSKKKTSTVTNDHTTIEFVEQLKQRWLETIDAIPDPLLVVQENYSILKANQAMADIADINIKNLVGKKCYEIFAGRSSPCEKCHMKQSKAGESLPGYEIYNQKNDRWYEVATRRLADAAGQQGVVQVYRDRTDAKRLQNQLAQNEKLASIGQLAGGFAHEINNPLGGILVFSQMLMREIPKDSPHYTDVSEIEAAAKRCKTIVENLLDYSRQRPVKPKIASCDLHTVLKNAVKFATLGHNQEEQCTIKLHLDAQKHILNSDHNRLTQVFLNIVTNAIHATSKGGRVDVRTSNSKVGSTDSIVTEISDNGTGIDEKHLSKIFEPFFTTKEPGQGTGLGLSIVHGIMQDLGGSIEVKSKKGKGTTFILKIPLNHSDSVEDQP